MTSHHTQIKVVNVRDPGCRYAYVGRKRDSNEHFGNPFSHRSLNHTVKTKDRDEACELFASWLEGKTHVYLEQGRRNWIVKNLFQLRNKNLGCYCAPKRCHAEELMRLANA